VSALRHWPDTLPTPLGPGYQLSPADPFLRTEMEAGEARQRRLTFARRDRIQAVWRFDGAEFEAFRAWFEDAAWSRAGHSDDLSAAPATGAAWVYGIALTASGVLAGRIVETAETGPHMLEPVASIAPDRDETRLTVSLRAAGRSQARVGLVGRDGTLRRIEIDLDTGAVSGVSGVAAWAATPRGSGWWRIVLTTPVGTGGTTPRVRLQTLADGATNFPGDPSRGIDAAELNLRPSGATGLYLPTDAQGRARGAAGGPAWALIPLWTGGDYALFEARFEGMWRVEILPGLNTQVTAPLEVRHA
jgi:hypothetical protein